MHRWLVVVLLLAGCAPAPTPTPTEIPNTPPPPTEITDADSDGDGVADDLDLCDGQITGATGTDETGCPTELDPYIDHEYDHDAHRLWYRRYWTGNCEDVPGFCLPGDPSWFNVVDELEQTVPEAERGVLRNRLWAFGRTVGHEWASDPDLNDKQIVTRDLRRWGNQLENAEDLLATITEIEEEVCALLGEDAFEGGFSTAPNCV